MRIGAPGPMGRILVRGEPGHDIIPELYPAAGEPVIDKPGKGAFYQTDLDLMLKNRGIETLLVCGVTTEVCVNTTVREANDRGFRCVVLSDCCASYFPEFHDMGLEDDQGSGRHLRLGLRLGGGDRGALGSAVLIDPAFIADADFYQAVKSNLRHSRGCIRVRGRSRSNFSALPKPMNLPMPFGSDGDTICDCAVAAAANGTSLARDGSAIGDDCVDPSPTLSAPALMIALGTCRARWDFACARIGTGGTVDRATGVKGRSVSGIQAVSCPPALGRRTRAWRSPHSGRERPAADMPSFKMPPPPPPAPTLDIHGFFDVTRSRTTTSRRADCW